MTMTIYKPRTNPSTHHLNIFASFIHRNNIRHLSFLISNQHLISTQQFPSCKNMLRLKLSKPHTYSLREVPIKKRSVRDFLHRKRDWQLVNSGYTGSFEKRLRHVFTMLTLRAAPHPLNARIH